MNPEDAKLRALLLESRPTPELPPRFEEGVWARIEKAERAAGGSGQTWIDSLVVWLLRPRLAMAAVAVLCLAGAAFGARSGAQVARHEAEAQYLAAVAPNSLR